MNAPRRSYITTTSLAIFSMLFGAGNLIFPLWVGIISGSQTPAGMTGFLLTAVCLPVIGLITMILFDGDYSAFFGRLGKKTGAAFIFFCMLIIGPLIGIPRIVTVSHMMITPFLPSTFFQGGSLLTTFLFSLSFLGITFAFTYRENKIVQLLGKYISPALLLSLSVIIIKGWLTAGDVVTHPSSAWAVFKKSLMTGYETLDLLGTIFFGAIILNLIKTIVPTAIASKKKKLALVGLQAGIIGTLLLGIVYIGMGALGAWHGVAVAKESAFRVIAFRILGSHGAALIGTAVLMACLSTAIALSAVVAEYIQHEVCNDAISFVSALTMLLAACLPLSTFGLNQVLKLTGGPITYIGYPVIIAITLCNLAYKLFGFKPIKTPVALTFVVALASYL